MTYSHSLWQTGNTDLPAPVANRWSEIINDGQVFIPEKAMQCFEVVSRKHWQEMKPQSIEQAVKLDAPTIGAICKYMGNDEAVQLVAEMIAEAVALLNVGKNIRAEQVYPIAEIILAENKHLTVADFRALVRMGITGKFGVTYDRLDVAILSEWCTKYFDQRCAYGEGKAAAVHLSEKVQEQSNKVVPAPKYFSDFVKKLTEKAESKAEKAVNFEPDDIILKSWKADYHLIPPDKRPSWETYKQFQVKKMKKQL